MPVWEADGSTIGLHLKDFKYGGLRPGDVRALVMVYAAGHVVGKRTRRKPVTANGDALPKG